MNRLEVRFEACGYGAGGRMHASAAHVAVEESMLLPHDEDPYVGLTQRGISVAMRFAEDHPSVPLKAVLTEVRHANLAVPVSVEDRSVVIISPVAVRLGIAIDPAVDEVERRLSGEGP